MDAKSEWHDKKNENSSTSASLRNRIQPLSNLLKNRGVHSVTHMLSAGFKYTGNGNTCICIDCGLEVSNWTSDMIPFIIHSKQKPDCSFVRSMMSSSSSNVPVTSSSASAVTGNTSILSEQENPSKLLEIEPSDSIFLSNTLIETVSII